MTEPERQIKTLAATAANEAHARMFAAFYPALVRHVTKIIGDAADAEDIAIETLVCAMREPQLFEPKFRIRPWLYRVATNRSFNYRRDQKRRAEALRLHLLTNAPFDPPDIESRLMDDETRTALTGLINKLSPDHGEILRLRHQEDLSYLEIAARLQVQLGTVMSRLSRAHDRLTSLIKADRELQTDTRLSL